MDIFIMMNNYMHDFAVALLFASLLVLHSLYRMSKQGSSSEKMEFMREIFRHLNRVVIGCWVFIIIGGVIRTVTYEEYEWMEAAGRGQITALVIKHILLVSFIIGGTYIQIWLRKHLRGTTL